MAEGSSNTTTRKVIFWALIILPFGTVVLGALSFVLYFNKQEKAAQRSIRYAAGLRRDLNEADLQRHEQVLSEALRLPSPERSKVAASYLESTLGPENMGYTVRVVADRSAENSPPTALEVESTGSKRPQDVVLVLGGWLPPLTALDNQEVTRPMAALLGVAHALAGEFKTRTIRFVVVQDVAGLKAYYTQGVGYRDRIQHVILLGGAAAMSDTEVQSALHLDGRGAVLLRPKATNLTEASALKKQIEDLAERL